MFRQDLLEKAIKLANENPRYRKRILEIIAPMPVKSSKKARLNRKTRKGA